MFRKGVSAVIINSRNEFLLVNLNSFEERFFAIPGGGIENGETLTVAVYREILEELGIKPEYLELHGEVKLPLRIIFKTPKIDRSGNKYIGSERNFFGFKFVGDDTQIKLQADEIRMFKWVPLNELDKYLLFDNQYSETLEKVIELFPKFKLKF